MARPPASESCPPRRGVSGRLTPRQLICGRSSRCDPDGALAATGRSSRCDRSGAEFSLRPVPGEVLPALEESGRVHETDRDLEDLQRLLDASYARAGEHLRSIWGEDTRLDAGQVSAELAGVQILDLATVTPRGEPRVAPVDGLFFRGHFWFGSAENSGRFRNIRANPAVSGAVTRGLETFLVLVHGHAVETDPRGPDAGGFAEYPRALYDFDWDAMHPDAPYARIEASTLLAFRRP